MTSSVNASEPQVFQFGPIFKGLSVLAAVALIALGLWGTARAYDGGDLAHQFGGMLLSLIPMAVALFLIPALWRCRLTLYKDHLEYRGILVDRVIRKADVQASLQSQLFSGLFLFVLKLHGKPMSSLRIALLGQPDDVLGHWLSV